MKELTQVEKNKLIAEFDNYWSFNDGTPDKIPTDEEIKELKYHSSWDALMPVVDKIRNLRGNISDKENGLSHSCISIILESDGHSFGKSYKLYRASIRGELVYQRMINSFQHTFDTLKIPKIENQGECGIDILYKTVVQFIQWYNENKPK